jgi:hypothetical protein
MARHAAGQQLGRKDHTFDMRITMTTTNDSNNVSEVPTTDTEAKPRLSLRREKLKKLVGVRSALRTGGCRLESIEM